METCPARAAGMQRALPLRLRNRAGACDSYRSRSVFLLGQQCRLETMQASTALSHVKVLDLTRVRAGPTAVRQLADWGAQVIKIEMPGSDDTPDFMDRHSPDFQNLHRNKRSMTLNLKSPEGLDIF